MSQGIPTRFQPLPHTHALGDLSDVSGTPADGNVLQYNAGSSTWQPAAPATSYALSGLSDVALSSPTAGQFLKYVAGAWSNVAIVSADVTFGDIATDTTTGMRVATDPAQKVGFWGATPVLQPASTDQAEVSLNNLPGDFSSLTISADYNQTEIQSLQANCEELAGDVRALATLLMAVRSALVTCGLIKGST